MARKSLIVEEYARMRPREIFDRIVTSADGSRRKKMMLARDLTLLRKPGVYVLYRDDIPYYIGQAATALCDRLWHHARYPGARTYNFWNFFSAFVILDRALLDEVEGILIASMPTANSAKRKFRRAKFPAGVKKMALDIRSVRANPKQFR